MSVNQCGNEVTNKIMTNLEPVVLMGKQYLTKDILPFRTNHASLYNAGYCYYRIKFTNSDFLKLFSNDVKIVTVIPLAGNEFPQFSVHFIQHYYGGFKCQEVFVLNEFISEITTQFYKDVRFLSNKQINLFIARHELLSIVTLK